MTCAIPQRTSNENVFRIGREPDPWAWPDWAYAKSDGTFGNRWDDPRGIYRCLYVSSQRVGAFLETLAYYRPDPAVVAVLQDIEGETDSLLPGHLPADDWFAARRLGTGRLRGAFADVAHSESLGYLRTELSGALLRHSIQDLDASTIRGPAPRAFTQEVSRHIYECTDVGKSQFDGIRYLSRFGDDVENWALFERARPMAGLESLSVEQIAPGDNDLKMAIELHGVRLI